MRRLKVWWLRRQLRRVYAQYMEDFYEEFFVMHETTGSAKQAERCGNWACGVLMARFNKTAIELREYGVFVPLLEELKP